MADPATPLNSDEVLALIMKRELIPIQKWSFEKPEYPEFPGFAQEFFKKSTEIFSRLEALIHSNGNLNDLKHLLKDTANSLKLLIDHHAPQTRFSITGDVNTKIRLVDNALKEIPLLATDYLMKPQEVLNAFRLRGEFFTELLIRVNSLLHTIEMRLSGNPNINVKEASKAQYLIYEFVGALVHSNIFEIPENEKEVLEKNLFVLLNIPEPNYRSDIIGNINRNNDTFLHLRAIITDKKVRL
jgi:hypothetical protein